MFAISPRRVDRCLRDVSGNIPMDSVDAMAAQQALSFRGTRLSFGQLPVTNSIESCMVVSGEINLTMMTKGNCQKALRLDEVLDALSESE